jgi:hypothetical protein
MYVIMNHHKRDFNPVATALMAQGVVPALSIDQTDYYAHRGLNRYLGVAENYLNILEMLTADPWKVVMHDDLTLPPNLVENIEHILARAPDNIISFYNPTNLAYRTASERGYHALRTYKNFWGQCHAWPTELGYEFAKWARAHFQPLGLRSEDGMLWAWCSLLDKPVYAVIPSLVQHEGYDRSIFKNPPKCGPNLRNSATYDPDLDVATVDWHDAFRDAYPDNTKSRDFTGMI